MTEAIFCSKLQITTCIVTQSISGLAKVLRFKFWLILEVELWFEGNLEKTSDDKVIYIQSYQK